MISGVFSAISQTSHQTPFPPRRISSAAVCVGARPGVQKGLGAAAAARAWCWGPPGCEEAALSPEPSQEGRGLWQHTCLLGSQTSSVPAENAGHNPSEFVEHACLIT